MGYNLHFILTNEKKTTLLQIARGLKKVDSKYSFADGELFVYDGIAYAQIEINRPGDGIFEDDIECLKEWLDYPESEEAKQVVETLNQATCIFFFRVFLSALEGETDEERFKVFEPLWKWFYANRAGILYMENNGFYNKTGFLAEAK